MTHKLTGESQLKNKQGRLPEATKRKKKLKDVKSTVDMGYRDLVLHARTPAIRSVKEEDKLPPSFIPHFVTLRVGTLGWRRMSLVSSFR